MHLRAFFALSLLAFVAACSTGGSGSESSSGAGAAGTRDPNAAPCDSARALVFNGQVRGVPATLVQALRVSLAREVPPSTCDFTNYPGSPGIAAAVERALSSRSQADVDNALGLIEERVAAIQRDPRVCVPRSAYPCTTELAWLATQAARLPGGAGNLASGGAGGSGSGGVSGAAARGAASALPGEAQAATDAATNSGNQPAPSSSSGPGRPTAPVSASEAAAQAAANAQAHGLPAEPWLDKARTAAEAEASSIAANNANCRGGAEQLAAIAQAAAKVQLLGGSDAVVNDVMRAAQPVVKSVARQSMAGVDVGMTFPQISVLAQAVGIDVSSNTWMNDPTCTERWTLHVEHEQRMDLGAEGGVLVERWVGDVSLEVQSNGSGSGAGTVVYSGRMTNPFCNWQGDADNVRATFAARTPRSGRLTGNLRIESAPGTARLDCTEGLSVAGAASAGSASFIPPVDMPFQPGATVRPPMDDPTGVLAQTGFRITTTYTLRKG